jgi:hypothetical protein
MNFETEARRRTSIETANPAAAESNSEETVHAPATGNDLEPEPGAEQPYVRGESFVIDRTQSAAIGNMRSPGQSLQSETTVPLFDRTVAQDFRSRWNEIQVAFVDEPREAVRSADRLVGETIQELTESFTAERQKLEGEWGGGGEDSTEALRLAFQRYRSYFNRLLSV